MVAEIGWLMLTMIGAVAARPQCPIFDISLVDVALLPTGRTIRLLTSTTSSRVATVTTGGGVDPLTYQQRRWLRPEGQHVNVVLRERALMIFHPAPCCSRHLCPRTEAENSNENLFLNDRHHRAEGNRSRWL